jgi:NADH:ubiquinone oxidoreductase subunit E
LSPIGPSIGRPTLRWTARVCGAVACVVTLFLVADGVLEWGRVARETAAIEGLEEAVLTDAATAEVLEGERQKATDRSVAREQRNRRLAWLLLVVVVLFLGAAKRLQALRGERAPSLGEIQQLVTLGGGTARPAAQVSTGDGGSPALDLTFVDEAVAKQGRAREAAIPILQAIQTHYRYLPVQALRRVCELTELTPADLVGVASFYSQFRRTPVGKHLVRICHGTACHVAGIGPITDELRRRLEIPEAGDSDAEMRFTLDPVNCLGCCSLAPVMMVDEHVAGRLTPTSAFEALAAVEGEP